MSGDTFKKENQYDVFLIDWARKFSRENLCLDANTKLYLVLESSRAASKVFKTSKSVAIG